MIGSHATGVNATHKLVSVTEAYREAIAASQQEDPLLSARQQALRNQLNVAEERLGIVKKNVMDAEEAIYRILQEALVALQAHSEQKVVISLGELLL